MANPHPQATTAGAATAPGLLIVWLAGHFGIDIGAEEAIVFGGALTTVVLLVGRKGLRGILRAVWAGNN